MAVRRRLEEARTREERALQLWEERNRQWERAATAVASKTRKTPHDVLLSTTHRWREKIEDLDMIEASVPQVMKSGNTWEMSLRGGAGGVRYVKFGSSFPYPLYCPVKNCDLADPMSNTFMRVVHSAAEKDPRSGGEVVRGGEYYQARYHEFRKHILRRYPHRAHDPPSDPLVVHGVRAPTTDEPLVDDDSGAPVQHYEFEEEHHTPSSQREQPRTDTPAGTTQDPGAHEPAQHTPEDGEKDGPMLVLETQRLLLHAEPGELGQSSLRVSNHGSTAIFFNWKRLPSEPICDQSGAPLPMSCADGGGAFSLSDAVSGVLLPGDEHYFTFAFRYHSPSVLIEDWELQTVPAGVERIVISLRGVITARESDPVSVGYLSEHLDAKCKEDMMSSFFTELLNAGPKDNVFDRSDEQAEGRRRAEQKQKAEREAAANLARAKTQFARENESALRPDPHDDKWKPRSDFASAAAWEAADVGPRLYFHELLFDKTQRLYQNAHALARALQGLPEAPPPAWSGGVGAVVELLQNVPDAHARRQLLLTSDALICAAEHDHFRPRPEYPQLQQRWEDLLRERGTVLPLLSYSCFHRALSSAAEEMYERHISLQEQLGLIEAPPRGAAAKGKPGKAPPKGKDKKQEDEPTSEELKEVCHRRLEAEVRGMLGDAMDQALTLWQQRTERLGAVVDGSPTVTFADAITAREQQRAEEAAQGTPAT
eukprot:TRINITY_DN220_c1_g1_i1.p1 TRINITY_DN220_c1_g1~~TRINITY_DN220_c1_g1_i1.p1  ORF type:complete len:737 (+),score=289.64 TRINITY_DN220_c1_g1_i1:83-2212(+)